ncbi:MAG: tetratricopeptide repeat protein [Candidatus Limnocylindrales bacterium]
MARYRLVFVPIAALIIALLSYGFASSKATAGSPAAPDGTAAGTVQDLAAQVQAPDPGAVAGAVDTSDTDTRIVFWQARIKANPGSDAQYQYLGELFALKGRETGDIAQYALARQAFEAAIQLYPGNVVARSGLAVNLVTLHQWTDAIAQAKQILETDLRALGAVAVFGDASLEIGDLDTARAAFDTLRQKADGPAVESREARLAFLTGRTADAIRILDEAAEASANLNGSVEEQAFYHYSAGEYRFNSGDVAGAGREYSAALEVLPNYYLALAGRGRVAFAEGDLDGAIRFYQSAVAIIPKPELVAYLGDLYAVKGNQADAEAQYKTVDFIVKLNQVQAQVFNREIALFQATHHRDTAHAVTIARAELQTRKDIYGYDALAWALYNDGQASAALAPAQQAVSLGTQDPKLLYHLGMIEIAVGHAADGQAHLRAALTLNPAFDPLGAAAARTALGL